MADTRSTWKMAYAAIAKEHSLAKQLKLCRKARRLMQERTLELASKGDDSDELKAVDQALRDLWVLEEAIRKKIN